MSNLETESLTFNEAIARLQEIVQKLESAQLPLEETITLYQEGVQTADLCAARLSEAELKIEMIQGGAPDGETIDEDGAF